MRVAAGAWLLLLVLVAQLPETYTRKIDNEIDPEAEKDDNSGFRFLTTTLSSLANLFGSDEDEEKPEDNVIDKNDDDLNEGSPDVDPDLPQNDDNEAGDFSENGVGTSDEAQPDVPDIVETVIPPKIDSDPLLETVRDKEKGDEKDEKKPTEEPKEDVEELLEEIADTENKILKKIDDEEEDDKNSESPRMTNYTRPGLLDRAMMPASLVGARPTPGERNVSDNSSLMLSDMHIHSAGMPEIHDLEIYMQQCDRCLVEQNEMRCPLNDLALELKKWITELEELLSFGCQLGGGCAGNMKCCHSNDEALKLPLRAMTQSARQMYNAFQDSCTRCPRHGGWGDWCEWSGCSATCGPGRRTRSRKCNNPAPTGRGHMCEGMAIDTQPCGGGDCCTDGNWAPWTPWGPCSATCGSGMQDRSRLCSNPAPNYCGRTCPGPSSDMRPCESNQQCCIEGNWSPWGSWSRCSASCGRGSKERRRRCDNPPPNYCGSTCPGRDADTQMCDTNVPCAPMCFDGNWGPWQPWSRCSASCGTGMQSRMRRCDNPAPNFCGRRCSGSASDTQSCRSRMDCCVHGNWNKWEEWSECSASCGPGSRLRRRVCDNPQPNDCGSPCSGPAMESDPCPEKPCPIVCLPLDGNWSPWSRWSQCSSSCGRGMRDRSRTCSNPPPNSCGNRCPGSSRESDTCDSGQCCVNGNWGSWERWSMPSVSCGVSMRERRRRCNNPRPNHCGRSCPGPDMERDSYDTNIPCRPVCIPRDGNWSPWAMWSRCSVTCGSGMRDRSRTCSNPPPNSCGGRCPGSSRDTDRCDEGPCCVNGNWGSWGRWTEPTVSCGIGVRERRRRCDNPSANYCGRSCPGSSMERDSYDTRVPCRPVCVPQSGGWSMWSPWSPCSATCGTGMRDRSRSCTNPPPNECGYPCPGRARDTERCAERECCTRRTWSSWERWSQPSVTCGTAMRERRRRCDLPRGANDCGQSCPGRDVDRESYDTGVPCVVCVDGNWSPWTRWTPCSRTCGGGVQDRKRTCSNPPPTCGRTCMGPDKDMRRCNEGPCCTPRDGNWGPWNPWSRCSATCGSGSRERSRECSNPRPNDCGRRCPGSPRESDRCDGGDCCVNGNWSPWERWSVPTVTCGTGRRERRRRCDSPRPNFCGTSCPGREVDTDIYDTREPCVQCVDGNWGSWGSWGRPSITCGTGMRDRRRRCNNPQPNFCGRQCPGSEVDTEVYDTRTPCQVCVDGNWSPWQRWNVPSITCGTGTRERRRRCDSPRPNFCGTSCPGRDVETTVYDTGRPCQVCVDGNWSPWQRWNVPSITCGTGTRERRRRCDSPRPNFCGTSCPGRDVETTVYDTGRPCQVCVDGNWSPWQRWNVPSITCGTGTRERRRRCDSPRPNFCGTSCPGRDVETTVYDTGRPCQVCVDGNWSPWQRWNVPSITCGTGTRERRRRCDSPRPNFCGTSCPGRDVETTVYDTGRPCQVCVDGNWSPWQRWNVPSITCGTGTRERRRRCDSPRPNFCGTSCPGRDVETTIYDTGRPCQVCVNGNWGQWGAWGPCPVTCGTAMRERRRSCDSPPPNQCGVTCPGSPFETRLQRCGPDIVDGTWGPWGSWGGCSRTCGGGTQTRNRRCDASGGCGRRCSGFDTDSRPCGQGSCCVDRQWSQWGSWSQCDATCGFARRTRQRFCRSVGFGQDCGNQQCPGLGEEVDNCPGVRPCEDPWGPWSACSATCEGFGTRERRRISFSGFGLSGSQTEQETCQVFSPPCAAPADWTPWNEWCPCDCRKGVRSRRRTCEERGRFGSGRQVDISSCGAGAAREEVYCDVRDACPACVSDCGGRVDGNYPSCTSCNDYVRCSAGRVEMFSCTVNNYEYDAFIRKCVTPPSPSCALVECVSSCGGREDGRYHSCFGCGSYVECRGGRDSEQSCPGGQEFNAHSGRCGTGRSPSCIRSIRRSIDFMVRDAPADNYFPDELEEKERKDLYLELREKAGVAAKFNRSDEDVFKEEAEEEEKKKEEDEEKAVKEKEEEALLERMEEEEDRDKEEGEEGEEGEDSTVVIEEEEDGENEVKEAPLDETTIGKTPTGDFRCRSDCSGLKKGKYQSCKGCHFYLLCTHLGVARDVKCPKGKFWDDIRKKCKYRSHTCMPRDANKTKPYE